MVIHVGFGGSVATTRVLAIAGVDAAPIRRAVRQAEADDQLIDLTHGRRRQSVLFLDSGHIVLSATSADILAQRMSEGVNCGND